MAIDIDSLFGQAKSAAEQGMNDLLKQGGNAALGYLEQKGIDILQQDKAQKEQDLQKFTQQNLNGPPAPGSFGAYLSGVLSSPVLKQYGPMMLIAVAVIAGGSILLARKA